MARITRCKTYAKKAKGYSSTRKHGANGQKKRIPRKNAPKFEDLFYGNEISGASSVLSGCGKENSFGLSLVQPFTNDTFENLMKDTGVRGKSNRSHGVSLSKSISTVNISSIESFDVGSSNLNIESPDMFASLIEKNVSKRKSKINYCEKKLYKNNCKQSKVTSCRVPNGRVEINPLRIKPENIFSVDDNSSVNVKNVFSSTPGILKRGSKLPLNLSPVPYAESDEDDLELFNDIKKAEKSNITSNSMYSSCLEKDDFVVNNDILSNDANYIDMLNGNSVLHFEELRHKNTSFDSTKDSSNKKISEFINVATRRKIRGICTLKTPQHKLSRLVTSMNLFNMSSSMVLCKDMDSFNSVSDGPAELSRSRLESSVNGHHVISSPLPVTTYCDFTGFVSPSNIKCGKGWKRSHSNMRKRKFESYLNISGHLDVSIPDCRHSPRLSMVKFISPTKGRNFVLKMCEQTVPIDLNECLSASILLRSKKIGEGVYGEVFMVKPLENDASEGRRVLKIMPIEGKFEVNGEPQKTWEEIVAEILVSVELSNLGSRGCPSFVKVLRSWCLEGSYSSELLELWDEFDTNKGSENDRPSMFPSYQLYICLEFDHGGQDLESFVFNNATQAEAIFWQIAYGLAVAEEVLKFEHRDLHWGNVLVANCKEASLEYNIKGHQCQLSTKGVKSTIIDFTLSRLTSSEGVVFNDLSKDPSLFESEGDYQFDIYRKMKEANGNTWESFNPYTNILWLHYILTKMHDDCYYANKKTKIHKKGLSAISKIMENLLDFKSSLDLVLDKEGFS